MLLVMYFDNTTGLVKGSFYKVLHLSRATSKSIFLAVTYAFTTDKIPIRNMIALGQMALPLCWEVSGLYARLRELQGSFAIMCILLPKRLLMFSLLRYIQFQLRYFIN